MKLSSTPTLAWRTALSVLVVPVRYLGRLFNRLEEAPLRSWPASYSHGGSPDFWDIDTRISPSQAVQIMAISILLKDGELSIRGYDDEVVRMATAVLKDVGEEIAMQVQP